jgi:tRNA(Ile)-lysidine synthetase-like protein
MSFYFQVYLYWEEKKEYWISIKNKEKADKEIYSLFWRDEVFLKSIPEIKSKEEIIGKIIYLDQFYRHFYRFLKIEKEDEIFFKRNEALEILNSKDIIFWKELKDWELIFCLIVYKHLNKYSNCINSCFEWCKNKGIKIKENSQISKFFNDTYSKAYSLENIQPKLQVEKKFKYCQSICDYYPNEYPNIFLESDKVDKNKFNNLKIKNLPRDQFIFISLSGGVDSMVLLYMLKRILGWDNVIAVHILYNNRKESLQEFNFISEYCYYLKVPLYYYSIYYLNRDEIEREFYEEMTRKIRFNMYLKVNEMINISSKKCYVLLGHIKDDVVENIITNFVRCQHLSNLKKMKEVDEQMGVFICRPLLEIKKDKIYDLSIRYKIPYLKNTTPEWSNRGKFRNNFYPALISQYGNDVDQKVINFSEMITSKYKIINKVVYQPVFNSVDIEENKVNISTAIEAEIGLDEWIYILETLSHLYFKVSKPSINSVKNLLIRLQSQSFKEIKIQMNKYYQYLIIKIDNNYFLKLINL